MKTLKVWCSYTNPAGSPAGFTFTLDAPTAWNSWADMQRSYWVGCQCRERSGGERPGLTEFEFGYELLAEGESGNGLASSGKD